MKPNSNPTANLKNAAELLLKGGSLLNTSCNNCGGVQIRYQAKVICINCGLEVTENSDTNDVSTTQLHELRRVEKTSHDINTFDAEKAGYDKIIIGKISDLFTSIKDDNDLISQKIKLDLIIKYLDIMERIHRI
ncbi:MAG: Sjogren's syndrome/scleroderma autoantigen 1 family protein [Nitrososphaeraceae archaeon]|nr:Sjogren's syndrome/scleroderma autoantigen 1 family protein [Nitrososphaeraceae archaeon]